MLVWSGLILLAASQVFYHFGNSLGQIYRDQKYFSNRSAISGSTSSPDPNDVIPTNRGAFLPETSSGITLYPNDLTSDYTLINTEFTFGMWIMILDQTYSAMYQRRTNSGYELRIEYEYSIDEVRIYICNPTCISQNFDMSLIQRIL